MELHDASTTPAQYTAVLPPDAVTPGLRVQQLSVPPGTHVLLLAGEVDGDTAPALADALDAALGGSPAPDALVVDCSGLRFCACAGLNEFLRARHAAAAAGIRFALAALTPQVARLLDLTDTFTAFEILPEGAQPAPRRRRSGPTHRGLLLRRPRAAPVLVHVPGGQHQRQAPLRQSRNEPPGPLPRGRPEGRPPAQPPGLRLA
ncbi:anti-sigma factor antagonist, partial [Streptomyces sp. adm13(2018)]|uniref:STAS domain-containing protein n=1 Tax=Streptomyces sp. adm13(2018) TaxID=2479007 RepID=UPI0011CE283B